MSTEHFDVGGWMSVRIWEAHEDKCDCRHCEFVNAHLDGEDDIR